MSRKVLFVHFTYRRVRGTTAARVPSQYVRNWHGSRFRRIMCFQSANMLIKYANGSVLEGVLVSLRGSQLRVAPKNGDDLLEFNLVQGIWISEHCEPVTFDLTLGLLESIGFSRDHQSAPLPQSPACEYVN